MESTGWNRVEIITSQQAHEDEFTWHKGFFQIGYVPGNNWQRLFYELIQRDISLFTVGDVQGKDILDIGCGSGMYAMTFSKMGAKSVSGIDLSERLVDLGMAFMKKHNVSANLIVADCTNLPFADGSFDLIFSGDVFEHITPEQKSLCIKEAYRVLKPGGTFTIKTPNLKYLKLTLLLKRIKSALRFKNPFNEHILHTRNNPDCEHHGLTDHKELRRLFLEQTFHEPVITYQELNRPSIPLWVQKMLKKNLLFNESVIITARKPIFLGLYP
jgi:2-polyprenyl-3-methyl-5-hydroxy-6-metoxy-1,4-benzoquinol methylase